MVPLKLKLQNYGIKTPTIQDVSKAVISIRNSKLPDPKTIGNSGSFFKNPVVSSSKFEILQSLFPLIPHYKVSGDSVKIPAAWLIDTAGFKGKTFGNFGVHAKQALVLVNYGGASGMDILNLSLQIQKAVKLIFDIDLETEVNILYKYFKRFYAFLLNLQTSPATIAPAIGANQNNQSCPA